MSIFGVRSFLLWVPVSTLNFSFLSSMAKKDSQSYNLFPFINCFIYAVVGVFEAKTFASFVLFTNNPNGNMIVLLMKSRKLERVFMLNTNNGLNIEPCQLYLPASVASSLISTIHSLKVRKSSTLKVDAEN